MKKVSAMFMFGLMYATYALGSEGELWCVLHLNRVNETWIYMRRLIFLTTISSLIGCLLFWILYKCKVIKRFGRCSLYWCLFNLSVMLILSITLIIKHSFV